LKPFNILILGGTSDARRLANTLIETQHNVIYSIAGLVRTPDLNCEIHIGGFTATGGLEQYIQSNHISNKASIACAQTNIQYIRFERPAWAEQKEDNWLALSDWSEVLSNLKGCRRVFLTAGQTPEEVLQTMAQMPIKLYLRTAVKPSFTLPENVVWIKAIGPFDETSEKTWLKDNQVDLIVSKNSGGTATYGKIAAARELGILVCMFKRPTKPKMSGKNLNTFDNLNACIDYISTIKPNKTTS